MDLDNMSTELKAEGVKVYKLTQKSEEELQEAESKLRVMEKRIVLQELVLSLEEHMTLKSKMRLLQNWQGRSNLEGLLTTAGKEGLILQLTELCPEGISVSQITMGFYEAHWLYTELEDVFQQLGKSIGNKLQEIRSIDWEELVAKDTGVED